MFKLFSNPAIVAALVSAGVTFLIFLMKGITGSFWDKYFHKYKLRIDHEYDQRKKIKEAISRYKVPLLSSAEDLNHRLWNFSDNCHKGWHSRNVNENISDNYYLQSFCYRLLAFLAWCKKFERESIYLDSTLSGTDDLYFVKYIKMMQGIFSDAYLFEGRGYDSEHDTDHFFKDELTSILEFMITPGGVITFAEFKTHDISKYERVAVYISAILSARNCNKWYLINNFHYVLMAFLSKYGYDYQVTELKKLKQLRERQPDNVLASNLEQMLKRSKLNRCKEIKKVMGVLRGN